MALSPFVPVCNEDDSEIGRVCHLLSPNAGDRSIKELFVQSWSKEGHCAQQIAHSGFPRG